jgi:hypothetical protein
MINTIMKGLADPLDGTGFPQSSWCARLKTGPIAHGLLPYANIVIVKFL